MAVNQSSTKEPFSGHKKVVVVVGIDHSPWTQAVLFGLTAQGYRDAVKSAPGCVIPVSRLNLILSTVFIGYCDYHLVTLVGVLIGYCDYFAVVPR